MSNLRSKRWRHGSSGTVTVGGMNVICGLDDGRWSGHVDLGALGLAGRWADLAVATWSTTWNYGPGWETPLLQAYGVAPDPDRTRYYRLLYDLDQ
jgi:aminoglycoside phosphotransferase